MSYYKEKRIRKLKKKRIWPSILGLFLITSYYSENAFDKLVTDYTESN